MQRARSLIAAAGIALAASSSAAAPPQRVVSLHLCADQLLLGLADRSQIAFLSRFAADPDRSYMAPAAKGIPGSVGTAEEVVAARADLVLAGAQSARLTVAALQRLGFRVIDLPQAQDFDAIRRQTMRVAAALGHPARGRALVAAMDRQLAAAREDGHGPRPVAAIWQPGGFTSGRDTLENAVLNAAGIDNLGARIGISGLGRLPLERLVLSAPDLVVNWIGDEAAPSLARESLHHPALRRAVGDAPVVAMPPRLWTCGTWFAAEAVARLADARRRLGRGAARGRR